jgi:2-polyprenyl-3-methyl-5-hydroxy-6-metoxy-1,4-benzoquinol methylase
VNTVRKFDFEPQLTQPLETSSVDAQQIYTMARTRLVSDGHVSEFDLKEHLDLLDDLMAFSLGRFLLQNHRLNGYWYDYAMRTYTDSQLKSSLEQNILYALPIVLAKRHSFKTIQTFLQQNLQNGMVIGSAPCGLMGDILSLDYSALKHLQIVGIDSDLQSIIHASEMAEDKGLSTVVSFVQGDLSTLAPQQAYHVLVHHMWHMNGFNKGTAQTFINKCFKALKPGGVFVTTFNTCSPDQSKDSPWNMEAISPDMLRLQTILFSEIIRNPEEPTETFDSMAALLKNAGFSDVEFIPDPSKMVATVLAKA